MQKGSAKQMDEQHHTQNDPQQPDNVYKMPRPKKHWDTVKIAYAVAAFAVTLFLGAAIDECSGRNDFSNLEMRIRDEGKSFKAKAAKATTKDVADYWNVAAANKETEAQRVHEMNFLCPNKNYQPLSCPNLWNGQQAQAINVSEGQR